MSLNEQLLRVPSGFSVHRKLKPQLERRRETIGERGRDRLGAGGGARVRLAARPGHADPPDRPGHRARHVQPAPSLAPRHEDGREVHADPEPEERDGPVRAAQQPAVGDRMPRLRVRLLGPGAGDARSLGGAVRRLRQRGAGGHRPVPGLGPRQVGPDVAAHAAPAPRLRGLRAGALERPRRALPPARRRGQHPRGQRHDARAVLPPAAPPGARSEGAPARRHDAEEPAAAAGRRVARRRAGGRWAPGRDRRPGAARARARTSRSSSSAPARSITTSSPTRRGRRRSTSRSRASSCCTRSRRTSCAR